MNKSPFLYLLSFICVFFIGCNNQENSSSERYSDTEKIIFENKGINNLYHSFEDANVAGNVSDVKKKKYPDYYGGAYVAENQRTVVIIIVDENPEKYEKEFRERLQNEPFELKRGRFSYNELLNILNKFGEFLKNNTNEPFLENVIAGGIYEDRNLFYIELLDTSKNVVNEIKERFMDSPAIMYEKGEKYVDI